MGVNQVGVSYTVPAATTYTTVKTFTVDTAVASGICVSWARISCCPGLFRVLMQGSSLVAAVTPGSVAGLHFQSGVSTGRLSVSGREAISAIRLEAANSSSTSLNCANANVELKLCITISDAPVADACVCAGTCGGNASYVDVTG